MDSVKQHVTTGLNHCRRPRQLRAFPTDADLHQIFADSQLARKVTLRSHKIRVGCMRGCDVRQHWRFRASGLRDFSYIVDGCVRAQQVLLECDFSVAHGWWELRINPTPIDDFMHEHISVVREANQVIARRAVA